MSSPIATIENLVSYLGSPEALRTIEKDPYWPKWDSPWWHMLLLHELGETKRIPENMIRAFTLAMNRYSLKIFPIQPGEMPAGVDPFRETPCHCQLGNVYQVLAEWGVDVDRVVPWIRPWFLKYQMADGGFNCDNDAYLVADETPSSMVGTIAVFEAVLLYTPRPWSEVEQAFLQKGAHFLMGRKLMRGSQSVYNASERVSAEKWQQLCFPRFYYYDILRGLNALMKWSEQSGQIVPAESIRDVVLAIVGKLKDGKLHTERKSYLGIGTLAEAESGVWKRQPTASIFPLLDEVSRIGDPSASLTKQWNSLKRGLASYPEFSPLISS